ncbi:RNA polymerase sigma factor [Pseudacidovorax intermedius]|uniref:RNA polymerase sigma-70 factor (ECF subfamily) n=1 Tax=Pseudacidovorax intermedius TaxID=433924 RepID=A0A370FST6_9BURK|nr:DUF6596 domain-containing protein [Pseudacidovorax intermedius]RDI29429.1 RNA polymerase sigma-70 factor (ECF subfamily) [Pseudacidovorax intermedius]
MTAPRDEVRAVVERTARDSYGRLLALLCARSRDIAASEDALADAFEAALHDWPRQGLPQNPPGWLLTVARRRLLDQHRHSHVMAEAEAELLLLADELGGDDVAAAAAVPDERLRLLFVCAHPAIQPAARAPLMLQAVLGLDVARMAGAFLTAPATLSQRLVRAKAKVRASGVAFEFPRASELAARLQDVLEAIYAAYGTGWDEVDGADAARQGLTAEAVELGRILCGLMPREPEPLGLLALMLFCESRRSARRGPDGGYVPLSEQDVSCWDEDALHEAEASLRRAAAMGVPGAYQYEAAIQSAHTHRRLGAVVPAAALLALHDARVALTPSLGARVSRACALGEAQGADAALAALDAVHAEAPVQLDGYQPWWAARAHWLARRGDVEQARDAYVRAMGLSASRAVREYLAGAAARLSTPRPV